MRCWEAASVQKSSRLHACSVEVLASSPLGVENLGRRLCPKTCPKVFPRTWGEDSVPKLAEKILSQNLQKILPQNLPQSFPKNSEDSHPKLDGGALQDPKISAKKSCKAPPLNLGENLGGRSQPPMSGLRMSRPSVLLADSQQYTDRSPEGERSGKQSK